MEKYKGLLCSVVYNEVWFLLAMFSSVKINGEYVRLVYIKAEPSW